MGRGKEQKRNDALGEGEGGRTKHRSAAEESREQAVMTLGALGRKFRWQAWKDWLGKKNHTGSWKKRGGRYKGRKEADLAQKHMDGKR